MSIPEHPTLEYLALFADGNLAPLAVQGVASHLDECLDCALEIAVAIELRDLQEENLISYPGPARREAGARRLRALASGRAGDGTGASPRTPGGPGPFDAAALLGGAIGFDASAHLLGPAAQPSVPMAGGYLASYSAPLDGSDGEVSDLESGEPFLEFEENPARDVRNDESVSSESAAGEGEEYDGLDDLIEKARALFSQAAGGRGHDHGEDSARPGHGDATDDPVPDSVEGLDEAHWQAALPPDLADPTEIESSSDVDPDRTSDHEEQQDQNDDDGADGPPQD